MNYPDRNASSRTYLKRLCLVPAILLTVLTGCTGEIKPANTAQTPIELHRPNILLIVADDMATSDIGVYGGEIDTPTLDSIAAEGASFTSFYTQASCSPTRAMMLTGVDNHRSGLGTMAEDLLPHHRGLPGYAGHLNDRVVTVASLLKDAGYYTSLAGKWHLGTGSGLDPVDRGFDDTYALMDGGANHFNGGSLTSNNPRATYTENGEEIRRPIGEYSSELFTDKIIAQIDSNRVAGKPFFAYLAFTAPHWPLQAPRSAIEKYENAYADGWQTLREDRFQRMKNLGLVDSDLAMPPMDEVPDWESLSQFERDHASRRMAVYAAMVDNMDRNIGRVVEYLKQIGEYDNTVIVFMSDNGTEPFDRSQRGDYKSWLEANYDNSLENIGDHDSYVFYGHGWAQAGSVPGKYYKSMPTQGGIHSPLIVRIPGVLEDGIRVGGFSTVLDLTPTFLELAGVRHPGTEYRGRSVEAPIGRSLLPYLKGEIEYVYGPDEPVCFELFGHAAVFSGRWKAVRLLEPWSDRSWQLYNLDADPGEQTDMSQQEPGQLAFMVAAFERYKQENSVVEDPAGVTAYPVKPYYVGPVQH